VAYLQPAHGAVGVEQVEHLLVKDLVERAAAQVLDAATVAPLLPVCSKTIDDISGRRSVRDTNCVS
jgi:hypothetical protein